MKPALFSDNGTLNLVWAMTVVEQLVASGVKTLCISPGYRNSPLILAAQKQPEMECVSILDERASAFFALGLAKRLREPVAVASTSGTACANFFPAILEARYSHAPLVVITADRPQELVGLGANQTMDQYGLYGNHVNYFANLEVPVATNPNFAHLVYEVNKAVCHARDRAFGPVHINIGFEEPLLPKAEINWNALNPPIPLVRSISTPICPAPQQLERLTSLLATKENKVLFLGPGNYSESFAENIIELCNKFNILLLAEPASGICFGPHTLKTANLFTDVENFLRFYETENKSSQLFIRIGAPLISKKAHNFFNRQKHIPLLLLDEFREMRNPALGETIYVDGNPELWVEKLTIAASDLPAAKNKLIEEFRGVSQKLTAIIAEKIQNSKALTEWFAAKELLNAIPNEANIFLGNSMPIRDFNSVATALAKKLNIFHNRGLSGIDGLIASALGTSFKNRMPTFLWIGDLSAIHDIGSLAIAKNLTGNTNLTICILNNQGGEIFRNLATKEFPEEWFTTPQTVDFEKLVGGFGLEFVRVRSQTEFSEEIRRSNSSVRCVEIIPELLTNAQIREF